MEEIESLPIKEKEKIFEYIDLIIRDVKIKIILANKNFRQSNIRINLNNPHETYSVQGWK